MSPIQLQSPFLDGGIRSINFFNGRLLSAEDLSQQATAHQEANRHLGLTIGEGVASGLQVSPTAAVNTQNDPRVTITPGLAINRLGRTLALPTEVDVSLARPQNNETSTPASATFDNCGELQPGAYITGAGAFLLTIGPASGGSGRAPVSGLGNVAVGCNSRYNIEGVQFRLIELPLKLDILSEREHLRNRLAYACFDPGTKNLSAILRDPFSTNISSRATFLADPFGPHTEKYGLLDALRPDHLTDCEVPLAIVYWTLDNGIEFIDTWSVRRRLINPPANQRWSPLLSDRRVSETEAMFLQFEEQIEDIRAKERNKMPDIQAAQRFEFFPPVGMLPVSAEGSPVGFNTQTFFGARAPKETAIIQGSLLRGLLHEALYHEPIDLRASGTIQPYLIFENVQAVKKGQCDQLALVFASRTLPFRGVAAQFEFASLDLGRIVTKVSKLIR